MKKIICTITCFISIFSYVTGQVAINKSGALPAASAMLDIGATNAGLLIPRMTMAQRNAIATPSTSLLIYQTDNQPGFYFNSGQPAAPLWVNLSGQGAGWQTSGNTTNANQFIGTLNNQALKFKINNLAAGELNPQSNNISLGIGSLASISSGSNNIAIGKNSLRSNIAVNNTIAIGDSALASFTSFTDGANTAVGVKTLKLNNSTNNTAIGAYTLSNSSSAGNTAVGSYAMSAAQHGSSNTAIGAFALQHNNTLQNTAVGNSSMQSNTDGLENAALGFKSLIKNTTGDYNTAIGSYALAENTLGENNVALGMAALDQNISGSYNTGLGRLATTKTGNLTNATAVGAYAQVDCNNCLVLGSVNGTNYGTSNVNVGIGVTNPAFPLSFAQSVGDKISLWGGSGNHYGLGIQASLLQIYTAFGNNHIVFGHGSTEAFTQTMRIWGDGDVSVAGSVHQSSDRRLKKDILPIEKALDKLANLEAYQYHWKDSTRSQSLQIGLIAQEVQSLYPELVREDGQGNLAVNYSGLVPLLIVALKELKEEVAGLKRKNGE